MSTPIDEDDFDVRPLDLDACDPDEREAIEASIARTSGGTAQLVPHDEVVRALDARRPLDRAG